MIQKSTKLEEVVSMSTDQTADLAAVVAKS